MAQEIETAIRQNAGLVQEQMMDTGIESNQTDAEPME